MTLDGLRAELTKAAGDLRKIGERLERSTDSLDGTEPIIMDGEPIAETEAACARGGIEYLVTEKLLALADELEREAERDWRADVILGWATDTVDRARFAARVT